MHEAVFENRFRHRTGALRDGVERHELRLHVGRKAGVFGGSKRLRLHAALRPDANETVACLDRRASFAQLVDHGVEVLGTAVPEQHIAAGCRHSAQKGAGLDSVGHHLMSAAMQSEHALDADAPRAVALDLRAHLDQHLGKVADLGLLRRILQHRFAFSQRRSHQEIFGAGYRHHIRRDAAAFKPPRSIRSGRHLGQHVPVLDRNVGAHRLHALDVLIDRPRPNSAAARQRHRGLAKARQQRSERQHRGAHRLDKLIRRFRRTQGAGVDHDAAARRLVALGLHAHVADQLEHGRYVLQARHVFQRHHVGRQQCGAELRQGRIFCAGDVDRSREAQAAPDQQFIHGGSVSGLIGLQSPFSRGKCFHRQRMHLVGLHAPAQRGIDALVPLDQPLPLKHTGNDGRVPVAAVTRQRDVLAGNSGRNDDLEFFAGHSELLKIEE